MKKIVIVGAGFAGLYAALGLEKQFRGSSKVSITLADRHDYHLFTPNLFEVATAEEEFTSVSQIKKSITIPLKEIFENKHVQLVKGEFTGWDEAGKQVQVGGKKIEYDYLVLALGSQPDFLPVPGADVYALPFSDLKSALRIRNALEFAVQSQSYSIQKNTQHFLIAGGGYSAVKLAAEMQSFLDILAWKYNYPREKLKTVILEKSDRLVSGMGESLSQGVYKRLLDLGVEIKLRHFLSKVNRGSVEFMSGEKLAFELLIWALGSKAAGLPKEAQLPRQGKGQIAVDQFFRVQGKENIFVLGNLAYAQDATGSLLPQNTSEASQQGKYLAEALFALIRNQKPKPFVPQKKSFILRLGGKWGIVGGNRVHLKGFVAYLIDLSIHFRHYSKYLGFYRALKYLFFEVEVFGRND